MSLRIVFIALAGRGASAARAASTCPRARVTERPSASCRFMIATTCASVASLASGLPREPSNDLALGGIGIEQRENHRQRHLAFAQIVAGVLAHRAAFAAIVEHIVDDLEGEAEFEPVVAERDAPLVTGAASHRTHFRRRLEQRCSLGVDDLRIVGLGGAEIPRFRELKHLALGDHRRRAAEDAQRIEPPGLHHHLERLTQQEVADQHTCRVAPDDPCSRPAAAQIAVVHHVVMEQCRVVHEFDGGRVVDLGAVRVSRRQRRRDRQHRPQPLAAGVDQVARQFGNHLDAGIGAAEDKRVDPAHLVARRGNQPVERACARHIRLRCC